MAVALERPAGAGRLERLFNLLRERFLLQQFFEVGEDVLDRAVLLQQLGRGLGPDAGDARDVIDGVADEHLIFDRLFGRDAPFLEESAGVHPLALAQAVEADVVVNELAAILVGGAKGGVDALLGRCFG